MATHKDLARELADVKPAQREHGKKIAGIFEILDKLQKPPPVPPRRRIGFAVPEKPEK